MKIRDATIFITGAASGIGLAAYRYFLEQGAEVFGVDCDRHAVDNLNAQYANLWFYDIAQEDQVEEIVEKLSNLNILPSVLINNAAILRDQTLVSKLGKKIKQHSLEDWNATIESNLTGTFLCARAFATEWIRAKMAGLIVNTSSVVRVGNAGQSAYSATKAAVDALTVTWANELSMYNIRVAAIAYGFAKTGMTNDIPKMFLHQLDKRSKVKRFAYESELVGGLEFIIENDYYSGRTLELDGGMRF